MPSAGFGRLDCVGSRFARGGFQGVRKTVGEIGGHRASPAEVVEVHLELHEGRARLRRGALRVGRSRKHRSGRPSCSTEGNEILVVGHPVRGLDAEESLDRFAQVGLGPSKATNPPRYHPSVEPQSSGKLVLRQFRRVEFLRKQKGGAREHG